MTDPAENVFLTAEVEDMISFCLALFVLLIGFLTYGRVVEKVFGPDDRKTPAIEINDGVDCMPMKTWKALLFSVP